MPSLMESTLGEGEATTVFVVNVKALASLTIVMDPHVSECIFGLCSWCSAQCSGIQQVLPLRSRAWLAGKDVDIVGM